MTFRACQRHARALWVLLPAILLVVFTQEVRAGLRMEAVESSSESMILEVDFPALEISRERMNDQAWDVLSMEGSAFMAQPGAPDLPAFHRLLRLPDRSDLQITVLDADFEPLHGLIPAPNQERLHTMAELPLPWLEDKSIYLNNAEYPGILFEKDEPVLLRDARAMKVSFYPVQVNPVTGEGRVLRHLRVRVDFAGENLVNAGSGPLADPTPVLQGQFTSCMVHGEASESGAMETVGFNPGRLPGHYLIFANTQALGASALQNYIEWKRRRGHKVTVVSSTDISFTTTNIRNRIITEYNSADPVDFVLLVGDTEGTYALPSDGTSYDHFYSKIVGNDILGDVAVGRMSCDNATQLTTVCNKIISYESMPYMDNDNWLTRAGFTVGSSACALSMKILSRNVAAELVSRRGYDDIDTNFCVGAGHVVQWFNEGLSFYNYRGWIGMEGLDANQIRNLTQGPRTPVATIFTCSTGDFNGGDDYTEAFFEAGNAATPGGAVACMGFATASTHTRYNNVVVGGYYGGLLEQDLPEVGACLLQGKYELYQTLPPSDQGQASNFANWGNLMGDPGTSQWVGLPAPMTLQGAPTSLGTGADHLALTVLSNGQPVAEAAVCVYQNQGGGVLMQHTLLSDADGQVLLPLDGLVSGTLKLTATQRRHVPVLLDIPVAQQGSDLAVSNVQVDGGSILPGASNQAVTLTLENTGSASISGVISFTMDASYGNLVAPDQTLPELAPGATTVLAPVAISALGTLSDGDELPLMINLSGGASVERMAWLTVAAPQPSPTGTSTPGGPLVPGQSRTLRVNLQNLGSRTAQNLIVSLASNNAYYGQVASPPQSVGSLAAGASTTADFSVLINTLTMVGYQLPLTLSWTTSDGVEGSSELLAVVGTPSVGDPTGPDGYGYWAFESTDTNYDLAPTYGWIPVAPAEGGQGVELNIQDNGNEQDDGVWVTLPFTFTYYGRNYTRAMVCSNGFLAFDDAGFGEYDFRNHYMPSGMGPDAMIAPMWDDHLTTGTTAGVWAWFDATEHRYVISWRGVTANDTGGPNTFQLVLYDPLYHPTMTGDGPFMFQYQDYNDTQSAGTDFPYCTIGIKDETSTRGMTLRNAQVNASTMHSITDGTAVYFTTSAASSLTPPALVLGSPDVQLSLISGDTGADSLLIRNDGELPLIWSATLLDGGLARDSGGPDNFGYIWKDSAEEDGPVYNWLAPEGRVNLAFPDHDGITSPLDLGYTQFFYGEAFTQVQVSANGHITFSGQDGGAQNIQLPSANAPAYMIAPWWEDLKPEAAHPDQVWWWTNNQDSLVVSWDNVPHYNPFIYGGPIRAQVVMKANGEVTIQIGNVGGANYPVNTGGTCGLQGEAGVEGFTFIHNQDVSAQLPWAVRLTPPAWVETEGPTSGLVAGGDSTYVQVRFTTVPGFPLPAGTYETALLLTSNDLNHLQQTVPVALHVSINGTGEGPTRPMATELAGAWPNPFNPSTRVSFTLAQAGHTTVSIHNLLGQEVARLVDASMAAGSHQLIWDGTGQASGLYLVVLESQGVRDEMKVMLLK